jgi:hypothetical protein
MSCILGAALKPRSNESYSRETRACQPQQVKGFVRARACLLPAAISRIRSTIPTRRKCHTMDILKRHVTLLNYGRQTLRIRCERGTSAPMRGLALDRFQFSRESRQFRLRCERLCSAHSSLKARYTLLGSSDAVEIAYEGATRPICFERESSLVVSSISSPTPGRGDHIRPLGSLYDRERLESSKLAD